MSKALTFEQAANLGMARVLITDAAGIYLPQEFVRGYAGWLTTVDQEDKQTLEAGPESEWYWESWENVLQDAEYRDEDDVLWGLHQDGDLWAVREDADIDWEEF